MRQTFRLKHLAYIGITLLVSLTIVLMVYAVRANSIALSDYEGVLFATIAEDPTADKSQTIYSLKTNHSQYLKLDLNNETTDYVTGDSVTVKGYRAKSSDTTLYARARDIRLVEKSTKHANGNTLSYPKITDPPSGQVLAATSRNLNVGVIFVNLNITDGSKALNIGAPMITAAQAETRFFTGNPSARNYLSSTSDGLINIAGRVAGNVTINISGSNATTCATGAWADMADQAAAASGINLSEYTNIAYLLPIADNKICSWGYGDIGGRRTWYTKALQESDIAGNPMYSIYAHELGHNLGMHHAKGIHCAATDGAAQSISGNCTLAEYDDPFDVMGTTYSDGRARLLSASHRYDQNLLTDGAIRTVTTSAQINLSPSNISGNGVKLIRIPRPGGTLDIEYRQPTGIYDSFLTSDPVVNGISLRIIPTVKTGTSGDSQLIDATPATASILDSALVSGSFYDTASNARITLLSRSASLASVQVTFGVSPPSPTITTVTPASAQPAGAVLTIKGTGFSGTGTYPRIGGVIPTRYLVIDDTTIQAIVPQHDPGTVSIDVITSAGSRGVKNNAFTFTPSSQITISGRVYSALNGAPIGGVILHTECRSDRSGARVTTSASGTFTAVISPGSPYCVGVVGGLASSVKISAANHRKNTNDSDYWYQYASLNAFGAPMYSSSTSLFEREASTQDRDKDTDINFAVTNAQTPTPSVTPTPTPIITASPSPTVTSTPASGSLRADINQDGKVDVLDLSRVLSRWGSNDSVADINKDGTVGVIDLSTVLSNWGKSQ